MSKRFYFYQARRRNQLCHIIFFGFHFLDLRCRPEAFTIRPKNFYMHGPNRLLWAFEPVQKEIEDHFSNTDATVKLFPC